MSILLTGGTGFVGGQVLLRLLESHHDPVICLVRADSQAHAEERGRKTLDTIFGLRARRYAARVRWIPADLEQERLGLSPIAFTALSRRITDIYHCAASTDFDLSYEVAKAINVVGLQRVFALAEAAQKTGNFRRLNHVSTAYVTGEEQGTLDATFLPGPDGKFRNTYEETKAEAERFLRAQDKVPYCVFRPSIVTGDSTTGRTTNWNVVYYPMRLMADGKLPYVPSFGPALCDCVPVDWVADAIVALGHRDDVTGRTFNLTAGEQALSVQDVVDHTYAGLARRQGKREVEVRTKTLGRFAWALVSRWVRWRHPSAGKFLDRFAVYEPYTRVACVMDNSEELRLLAEEGVRCPPAQATFARVVDYALKANFGREQRTPTRAALAASRRLQKAFASAVDVLASGEVSGFGAVPA